MDDFSTINSNAVSLEVTIQASTEKSSYYALIRNSEHWRQILVFPAVVGDKGITLKQTTSAFMLWIELNSGKLFSFCFRTSSSFLSLADLETLARRVEAAPFEELDSTVPTFARLFRWYMVERPSASSVVTIAEDLVTAQLEPALQGGRYRLDRAGVRRLAQGYVDIFHEGLRDFQEGLDQEALHVCRKPILENVSDVVAYNYLIHPIERIRRYRRQAVRTFPLLKKVMSSPDPEDSRHRRLAQHVDSGNPLIPAVSDVFRVSKTVVRALIERHPQMARIDEANRFTLIADLMDLLKPDFWPATDEDWGNFEQWVVPVFLAYGDERHRSYPPRLASWLNDLVRDGYAEIAPRLERAGIDLDDILTLGDLEQALREYAVVTRRSRDRVSAAMDEYGVVRLGVLCRRWHDWLAGRMDENLENEEEEKSEDGAESGVWLTFIENPWQFENHVVVPLTTPWELKEEGRRMGHCVGSYASSCLYFGSHIFPSVTKRRFDLFRLRN